MRYKVVRINHAFLMMMFTQDAQHLFKVTKGLPEGTKFCYVMRSDVYSIDLVVTHESFEELQDGDVIPMFEPLMFWNLRGEYGPIPHNP